MEDRNDISSDNSILYLGIGGYLLAYSFEGVPSVTPTRPLWEFKVKNLGGIVDFVTVDRTVYALSGSKLASLNCFNGHKRWKITLPALSQIDDSSIKRCSNFLICSGNGYLTACSFDGAVLWTANMEGTGWFPFTMVPYENVIYTACVGQVFAVSPTGKIIWKNTLAGKGYIPTSLCLLPSGKVLVAGVSGFLTRISCEDGIQTTKSINLEGTGYNTTSVLLYSDVLIVASNGSVFAYSASALESSSFLDRQLLWQNPLKGFGYHYGASLVIHSNDDGHLSVIVGFRGQVLSLCLSDGHIEWDVSLPSCGYGFVSVCIYNSLVCALSKGYFYAIKNGTLLWKDTLDGKGIGDGVIGVDNGMDQQASNLIATRCQHSQERKYHVSNG